MYIVYTFVFMSNKIVSYLILQGVGKTPDEKHRFTIHRIISRIISLIMASMVVKLLFCSYLNFVCL